MQNNEVEKKKDHLAKKLHPDRLRKHIEKHSGRMMGQEIYPSKK